MLSGMNPTDSARQSIWYFPTLYANRTGVMAHLFTTLGGGYEWVNGELVCDFDYEEYERTNPHHTDPRKYIANKLNKELDEYFADKIVVHSIYDDEHGYLIGARFEELDKPRYNRSLNYLNPRWGNGMIERLREHAVEEAAANKYRRDNVDELKYLWVPITECYPMSAEYSNLANLPDDITDEWLDEAERMAHAVLETKWSLYHPDRPGMQEFRFKVNGEKKERTPEERLRLSNTIRKAMGQEPLTLEDLAALDRKAEEERKKEIEADKKSVDSNHKIARKALARIERIKHARRT
jgi:hypothetical protein